MIAITLSHGVQSSTPGQPATLDDVTPLLPEVGSALVIPPAIAGLNAPGTMSIAGVTEGGATTGVLAEVRGNFPPPLSLIDAQIPGNAQPWVQSALPSVLTSATVIGPDFRMEIDFGGAGPTLQTFALDWTFEDLLALEPTINGEPTGETPQEPEVPAVPGVTIDLSDDGDSATGGQGPDTINGGAGDDTIFGGTGEGDLADVISGGAGNDLINGGYGNDQLNGGEGNDTLIGDFGADTLAGGLGEDQMNGGAFSDQLFGGAGDDFLNGGWGHDRLTGGEGADTFFHLGIADHGSDWVQDYVAADGDVLFFGQEGASAADFVVHTGETADAGDAGVAEAFVVYVPSGKVVWALVDGAAQDSINLQFVGGETVDLLA